MKYDLVVFGGGTSGIACAYIASKLGLKTLLIEKTDVLGGAITQGLVIPSMKINSENINTDFFEDLKKYSDKYNARLTYNDGNEAWFNPELLKIVLDTMLMDVKCNILFSTTAKNIEFSPDKNNFNIKLEHKILSLYIDTQYIVDATANGEIFKILDYEFQNPEEKFQNPGMRFILSGININKFATWLEEYDKDRNVTTVYRTGDYTYLSTAYTWDKSKIWALRPIFDEAIEKNVIEYNDSAYFQVFSVPKTHDSLAFNCPRIILNSNENPNDPYIYSKSLIQGRKRIYRLLNFCKKYFVGFENAYISNISNTLGIRESYRIKGKYTMTKTDITNGLKPKNCALSCNYPIDIHSNSNNQDKLEKITHSYYLPLEALICERNDNLYGIGRIISADFESQSALRTQISCFSMGEAAAKDIFEKINLNKKL